MSEPFDVFVGRCKAKSICRLVQHESEWDHDGVDAGRGEAHATVLARDLAQLGPEGQDLRAANVADWLVAKCGEYVFLKGGTERNSVRVLPADFVF